MRPLLHLSVDGHGSEVVLDSPPAAVSGRGTRSTKALLTSPTYISSVACDPAGPSTSGCPTLTRQSTEREGSSRTGVPPGGKWDAGGVGVRRVSTRRRSGRSRLRRDLNKSGGNPFRSVHPDTKIFSLTDSIWVSD